MFAFVDPWSDVYACNVRPDLLVGNLARQGWDEIMHGGTAQEARKEVAACTQNCWMVASAKTAMRNERIARLPRMQPLRWVVANKLRVILGRPIPFARYVDYGHVHRDEKVVRRQSYLGNREKAAAQPAESRHYSQFEGFYNR
jgi:hypothetical protein